MSITWTPDDDDQAREWMRQENVRQAARKLRIRERLGRVDHAHKIARGRYEFPPPRIVRQAVEWIKVLAVLVLILGALQIGGNQ